MDLCSVHCAMKGCREGLCSNQESDISNREWYKKLQLLRLIFPAGSLLLHDFLWKDLGKSGASKVNPDETHSTAGDADQLFNLPECYFWWPALHALTISLIFFSLNPFLNNYLREKPVPGKAGLKYWSSQWTETQKNECISQIWKPLRFSILWWIGLKRFWQPPDVSSKALLPNTMPQTIM